MFSFIHTARVSSSRRAFTSSCRVLPRMLREQRRTRHTLEHPTRVAGTRASGCAGKRTRSSMERALCRHRRSWWWRTWRISMRSDSRRVRSTWACQWRTSAFGFLMRRTYCAKGRSKCEKSNTRRNCERLVWPWWHEYVTAFEGKAACLWKVDDVLGSQSLQAPRAGFIAQANSCVET